MLEDFLCRQWREWRIQNKTAHFHRVDAGILAKSTSNAVPNVELIVLSAVGAKILQQRPIGMISVLHLKNKGTPANPNIGVTNPWGYFAPQGGEPPSEVSQNTGSQSINRISPRARFYKTL